MPRKKKEEKPIFYSLDKILQKNATYNIIIGQRSNGKTYSVLQYAFKRWLENGEQLAIIRRWKEDITGKRAAAIFSALNECGEIYALSGGTYSGVTYWAGKFYACTYSEEGRPLYNAETDCVAYCFALSEMEHNKSMSYPKVTTILFDEFITRKVYLNDEFIAFMNTISTIIRRRTDVKIFMLGNTVNKFCPYFQEMGLTHISRMKQGTIDLYTYGDSELTVAVEYCETLAYSKEASSYFAFDNPKLHMITNGAWELDVYPHLPVKYKPCDIMFIFFILFDGRIFQCEMVENKDQYFIYIHEKTTELQHPESDLIYTLEYHHEINYSRNIFKPINKIQKRVQWFFETDRVYYQDNDVGDAINNYLKICKLGGV